MACASTGNLANSVAAHAAGAGLKSYVLIPADLEQSKVLNSLVYGTKVIGIHGAYDQVNRLCSEIAGKYGWGFVNVNLRPYYAEGSKTMGFEIVEQLGWRLPRHTVAPMASGSLLTKIAKSYQEAIKVGLIDEQPFTIHGAQATGCNPITHGVQGGDRSHPARAEAEDDREVAGHRHARGRLLRGARDQGDRRRMRGRDRRGDRRGHPAAGGDGRHLRRDGRRRDRRLREEADRDRQDSRATNRSCSASPATG